jgi:hypothetical protein
VVLASPAVTAAAGAGSVVAMGEEAVAMKSKTVTIEAAGVCSIKGKSSLKLQEADGPKGKSKSKATDKKGGPAKPQDAETEKRRAKTLWVRLDIDPANAGSVKERFELVGAGGYSQTKTVDDDMVAGDAYIDLKFTEIDPNQKYTLRVLSEGGAPSIVFKDIGFGALSEAGPATKDSDVSVEGPSADEASSEE